MPNKNYEYECENCKTKFWEVIYEMGICPHCGIPYWWDEDCTEDYSDCWEYVYWDTQSP